MFGTMEPCTTSELMKIEKQPSKLKFGIERLLSSNSSKNLEENSTFGKANPIISKPLPQVVVPCSDCELYRCCRLGSSGGCQSDMLPGMSGFFNAETYFAFSRNDNALYSGQPIRPFATRPTVRLSVPNSSSSTPSSIPCLTDAQVKVWFQNRRMKWRHSKEISKIADNAIDSTQEELHIDVDTIGEDAD